MTKNIKLIENIDLDEFKNNLKSSRESKNITIEEAAKTLHISVVILKNLENGELDKLANDVFTIGHIRTYLKWLGINPSLIIGDFKNVQNTELKSKNLKINVPYLKEDKITNLKVKNAPEINNTSKEDLDEESNSKSMPENVALENNYIHIKAIEDTWIEIQRNNSEVLITKIIKKDEKIKIPYEKDLILVTGNAGSIIIHINGKTINNIGMPGEVKRNISLNYDDLIKFLNN